MLKTMTLIFCILVLLAGCQSEQEQKQPPKAITSTTSASETNKSGVITDGNGNHVNPDSDSFLEQSEDENNRSEWDATRTDALKDSLTDMDASLREMDFQGSIFVRYGERILLDACYGLADREAALPHTDKPQYMIASMTKQFTAMCIMILQEMGQLSTNDTLDMYFKDFPSGDEITIHHLLTHSSGLPPFVRLGKGQTLQEQISSAIQDQSFQIGSIPGTQYTYSDTGYVLLSAIIEQAAGMDYETFLQKSILDPLDMRHTGVGYDRSRNPDLAAGYGPHGLLLDDPSSTLDLRVGAGAIYTTIEDLDKWYRSFETEALVTRDNLSLMHTLWMKVPGTTYGYGYGFFIDDESYGRKIVFHGGRLISRTFTGFSIYCPDEKISIMLLGNDEYHDEKMNLAFSFMQNLRTALDNDYMGETPPGLTPVKFADGTVSGSKDELNGVFTPDGNEFFFTIRDGWEAFRIYQMKRIDGLWSDAAPAPFSSEDMDSDPFISKDGEKLYFCSNRMTDDEDTQKDWNIWECSKSNGQWQDPVLLPFNTDSNEMYVSVTDKGDLYFHADYTASSKMDIYCSSYKDGTYTSPVNLGSEVNSPSDEYDPMIAPDGSYIIYTSTRNNTPENGDLYIAFRDDKGYWKKAESMGPAINSPFFDYCPVLSPDGRYLFFSSYRDYNRSLGDIYWISSKIIDNIKLSMKE